MALLRAVGASRRQVLGSLIVEAIVIGIVASLVGFVAGIGLSAAAEERAVAARHRHPRRRRGGPAPHAHRVAHRRRRDHRDLGRDAGRAGVADAAGGGHARRRPRHVGHVEGAGWSGASSCWPSASSSPASAWPATIAALGLGIALIFIGVFVLGPLIARPFARVIGAPLPRLRGISGRLAQENAMRNPKRTARTAAALMVGVALVAGISVLAASIKASVRDIFEQAVHRRLRGQHQHAGLRRPARSRVAQQLNQLPEVEAAAGMQLGAAKIDGSAAALQRASTRRSAGQVFDLEFVAGLDDAT